MSEIRKKVGGLDFIPREKFCHTFLLIKLYDNHIGMKRQVSKYFAHKKTQMWFKSIQYLYFSAPSTRAAGAL